MQHKFHCKITEQNHSQEQLYQIYATWFLYIRMNVTSQKTNIICFICNFTTTIILINIFIAMFSLVP